MADVVLLDFAGPPPGFQVSTLPVNLRRTIETASVWGPRALAAAWAKYKAENDPPGMSTRWAGGTYAEPGGRRVRRTTPPVAYRLRTSARQIFNELQREQETGK